MNLFTFRELLLARGLGVILCVGLFFQLPVIYYCEFWYAFIKFYYRAVVITRPSECTYRKKYENEKKTYFYFRLLRNVVLFIMININGSLRKQENSTNYNLC